MYQLVEIYKSIIEDFQIILWESGATSYRFKAKIHFIDNSVLFIREYLFQNKRKYSYHWQNQDNRLIIRWDNASHWRNIDTFPYHKHIGKESNVVFIY